MEKKGEMLLCMYQIVLFQFYIIKNILASITYSIIIGESLSKDMVYIKERIADLKYFKEEAGKIKCYITRSRQVFHPGRNIWKL